MPLATTLAMSLRLPEAPLKAPGRRQRLGDVPGELADAEGEDLVDLQPGEERREVHAPGIALLQLLRHGDELDALQLEVVTEGGLLRHLDVEQELVADDVDEDGGDVVDDGVEFDCGGDAHGVASSAVFEVVVQATTWLPSTMQVA